MDSVVDIFFRDREIFQGKEGRSCTLRKVQSGPWFRCGDTR
jgi:hypothetical protein